MPEEEEIARQDAIADEVFKELGLDASIQKVATKHTLSLQDKFKLTGLEQEFTPSEPVEFEQSFLVDVGKGIYNGLVIESASALANLAPTVGQALGADSQFLDSWITNVSDFFDSQKASYSDEASLPINEFKDITSSHVAKGIGEGVGFIAAMFAGGGALGASAKAAKLLGSANKAKAVGGWLASTSLMYGGIQKEALKAGLSKGNAARFSLGLAGIIGATEQVSLGYLGKLASKGIVSKIAQKEAVNVLRTANTKNPVALQKLFLDGFGKKMASRAGAVAKGSASEFTQEFSQTYIEEGTKQLWDEIYKEEKGKGNFGSDITNYQSFVEATFGGIIGGLIGGGGVFIGRSGVQEEGLFGYVNNAVQQQKPELITDLRGGLSSALEQGKMSEKQFKLANESITELENFAKDVKPKGIKDGVANYQLFQLNKLGKQADAFSETVKPNNQNNPKLVEDYTKRQGMISAVKESISKNFSSIFDNKKALTKNKDKFEGMLSDYGSLLTELKNGDLSQEEFDKRLKKFDVKEKKEAKPKETVVEEASPVENIDKNPYKDLSVEDINKELKDLELSASEETTEIDNGKKVLLEEALSFKAKAEENKNIKPEEKAEAPKRSFTGQTDEQLERYKSSLEDQIKNAIDPLSDKNAPAVRRMQSILESVSQEISEREVEDKTEESKPKTTKERSVSEKEYKGKGKARRRRERSKRKEAPVARKKYSKDVKVVSEKTVEYKGKEYEIGVDDNGNVMALYGENEVITDEEVLIKTEMDRNRESYNQKFNENTKTTEDINKEVDEKSREEKASEISSREVSEKKEAEGIDKLLDVNLTDEITEVLNDGFVDESAGPELMQKIDYYIENVLETLSNEYPGSDYANFVYNELLDLKTQIDFIYENEYESKGEVQNDNETEVSGEQKEEEGGGKSTKYGEEVKIKGSSLTPSFENGKYVYRNKKGEVSSSSTSAANKLSKVKGIIESWWNETLSVEKREEIKEKITNVLQTLSTVEKGQVSERSVVMSAIRGVKFSKDTSKDLSDVSNNVWISENGESLDGYVLNEIKDALVNKEFMSQEQEIDQDKYSEMVKDIINSYPKGITKDNISDSAVDKDIQDAYDVIDDFSNEYGLDLEVVSEKINLENGKTNESDTDNNDGQKDTEANKETEEEFRQIDEAPFQKEGLVKDKEDLISKNPELFKKIKDRFKKLFPNTPVSIVNKIVTKYGGEALGRVYKAGIEISKDKAVQTTLIHENAEIFMDLLGADNSLVKAGIELIRDTEYHKKAKEAYPELSEEGQLKEALVEALSESTLEDLKTRFEGSNFEKFKAFLTRFWNRTKSLFNQDSRDAMEMLKDDFLLRGSKVVEKKPTYTKKDSNSKKAADKNEKMDNALAKAKKVFSDFGRTAFGSVHTKSLLSNNPIVAAKIIDSLKALFPDIKINKDGIIKDGKFVSLKDGEKGMHIRNAFESMVAWANDAYLETPPHEYAHAYIEMYSESPLVKEAIAKYGSIEAVAKIMGRHYAGKKVSNNFKNWLSEFWNMIKSLAGSPDIGYALSEAFMKGEKLSSTEEAGFNTIEYQKKTPLVSNAKTGGVDYSGQKEVKIVKLNSEEALDSLFAEAKDVIDVKSAIYSLADDYKSLAKDKQGTKKGYRNVVDKKIIADLKEWIAKDMNVQRVKDYLDGKNEFPKDHIRNRKKITFKKILTDLVNAKNHEEAIENSVMSPDMKAYDIESSGVKQEISETAKRRVALYNKIKWKPLRDALKAIEKIMPYQINSRLITKYLSGSESSVFSNFYYKAVNYGENLRNSLISEFNDKLMEDGLSDTYSNWSAHKNPKSTISELETKVISTQQGDVELTMAELLGLYLANRQGLLVNGFNELQEIDGREHTHGKRYELSEQDIAAIESEVSNDPDMMKVVANIDEAMKFMSKEVSKTFLADNGVELTLEDNYFPAYSGENSFQESRSKKAIDDFKSINLRLGENEPINAVDPLQVLDGYKVNAASYAALALPIKNNRKIIQYLEKAYGKNSQEATYFESLKETLNQLEDPSQLFSGQGEKKWVQTINKLTSNFTVAVLGMNIPVMMKQSISFITAMEEISSKYLRMAGGGASFMPMINPKAIIKAITDPLSKGSVKWDLDTNSGTFAIMKKYSSAIKARIEGLSNREMGEALLGQAEGSDEIIMPWNTLTGPNKGKRMKFSKSRFMEGIRIFDAVTIENIWRAAEFEAEAEYDVVRGSDAFYEHVAARVESIISKTQPTFNLSDRTGLSKMNNPIARFFSMFSSATSKMAMLQIDGMLDFIASPTKENQQKMIKRSANILVTTAMTAAVLDMLKGMLMYGWDDDDELFKDTLITAASNNIGLIHGIGQIGRVAASQLDDKPWFVTTQHPVESLIQSTGMAVANLAKGNLLEASKTSLEVAFKASGMPLNMLNQPKQAIKRLSGSK